MTGSDVNITGTVNVDGQAGIGAKINLSGTISLPDAGDLIQFGTFQDNTLSGGQITGDGTIFAAGGSFAGHRMDRGRRQLHARGRLAGRKRRPDGVRCIGRSRRYRHRQCRGHAGRAVQLEYANGDGVVDDGDASILGTHWMQPATWADGDFNRDSIVNDADAAILAAHWGEGAGEESVPEPGSLVLLAGVAVMGMVYVRRRKA